MPAQEFKSVFTADISQYKAEMGVLKQTTTGVVSDIRSNLVALAGLSFAGIGVKELVSDIIQLGAEMQQTRTAFEVMLGSADAAGKVIGELNRFADYTPFDNAEVIKSGRLLMNAGVATEQLNGKLTTLGNIAAGAQVPLLDMVAIYAKAANKGKVQAEELNQLSERGVPVMQALATTLGRTTQEILDMGAKGQLSFALLDEALASLSANGGRYFGLMEKQSQNLSGRWSTVAASIRNAGVAIGEEAIPALSAALDEFAAAIDEMTQSGELDKVIKDTALALGQIAGSLKDITLYMIKHQAQIKSIAGGALWIGVAMKSRSIILKLTTGLSQLAAAHAAQGAAAAASTAATTAAGTAAAATAVQVGTLSKSLTGAAAAHAAQGAAAAAAAATTTAASAAAGTAAAASAVKVGVLSTAMTGVAGAATVAAGVLAAAFIGWKIGTVLADLLKLDEVFARLIMRAQGLSDTEIDAGVSDNVTASIEATDLVAAEEEKEKLQARMAKLAEMRVPTETDAELSVDSSVLESDLERINSEIALAQAASDQSLEQLAETDEQIRKLIDEREGLEKRLAGRATTAEREKISLRIGEIEMETGTYQQQAEAEIAAIEDTKQRMAEANAALMKLREDKARAVKDAGFGGKGAMANAYDSAIEDARAKQEKLRQLLLKQQETAKEYQAEQEALAEHKATGRVKKAEELSAAEKFRAEEQKRLQEEVSAKLEKLTKSETEQKKAEWAKQVASYREAYKKAGLDTPEQNQKLNELEQVGYAEIDSEQRKKRQSLYDHLAKLTLSETDLKKRELAKQLAAYREAGATQQQLARLQAAGLAAIERDKNKQILAAQKQLENARRNLAEHLANDRLDAMMRKMNRSVEGLRKRLASFKFDQEDGWRELASDPSKRRERRKTVALDQSIDKKMDALGAGENVRFTRREKERLEERERIENRLAEKQQRSKRTQRDTDRERREERRRELVAAVREAEKNLVGERRPEAFPQRPMRPAPPPARRPPKPEEPAAEPPALPVKPAEQNIAAPAPVNVPVAAVPEQTVPVAAVPEQTVPVAAPDQVDVPVAAPAPVNVPVAAVPEQTVPVAAPAEVNVPVAAPAEQTVPVAAPAPVNVPVAAVPEQTVPVAAPAPVNVPVAAVPEQTVPVAAPDQVDVPVAVPAPVNVPVAAVPEQTVPVAAPAEVNVPVAAPAEQTVPVAQQTIPLDSRPWLNNIRPNLKPEGPDRHGIVSAVAGTSQGAGDSGLLGQMLQELQHLNKRVFVVKGA